MANTVSIYQLKDLSNPGAFMGIKYNQHVKGEDYAFIYKKKITKRELEMYRGEFLEYIFELFNMNRPSDFKGHSLSVSDVVCININGFSSFYYVDSVGFYYLSSFNPENEA